MGVSKGNDRDQTANRNHKLFEAKSRELPVILRKKERRFWREPFIFKTSVDGENNNSLCFNFSLLCFRMPIVSLRFTSLLGDLSPCAVRIPNTKEISLQTDII
jgi:hypothetical protein